MAEELREVYVRTVLDIAKNDKNVFVLEADLSSSMGTKKIKDKLGDHYIDVGISEGQEICVAAGIAAAGGVAFAHSFAAFITRRVFDQIFVSLAYAKQHAILIGSDAGVTAESNGGTHMCFEDMALMRSIPDCSIYDVSDPVQFEEILRYCYAHKGVHYIRTGRKKVEPLYKNKVDIEKGYDVLKEGNDVALFACGIITQEAVKAAEHLKSKGIDAAVVNIHRIKPLPKDIIYKYAGKCPLFTLENHNIIGGLGSSVAEAVSEYCPSFVYRLGVKDRFGQVGKMEFLKKDYGLDYESVANEIMEKLNK